MPQRPLKWGHSTVETACPLDCPDSCSLAVTVENGRIQKIDGSRVNPVTQGFICAKVRRFDERIYGDARLKYPAIRKGSKGRGAFERVSWEEALNRIADRVAEVRRGWGAEAILPFFYGGSNGLLTQGTTDFELFRRLGASRLARTVCAAPTGAATRAMYGKMTGVAYDDYAHAQLILVWGANPSASGIHLVPYIRQAQRRGARLVVIDPRRTQLAKAADLHLAIRPGTDLPVALSMLRHLFESERADRTFLEAHTTGATGLRAAAARWTFERAAAEAEVDASSLEACARLYADASPAVIRCGWGLERNRNGGHAVMAVLALPAVAGKFGVRGGGYTLSNSAAWQLDSERWLGTREPATREINMNHLGRVLEPGFAPPVKLLFVYNCNPLATLPAQQAVARGLEREDLFTVVFDQVMTDTAAYADVILPATTFLEGYDIAKGYGALALHLAKPAIEAVGEARPNNEVFADLGRRCGVFGPDEFESDAETLLRVAHALPDSIRDDLLGGHMPFPPGGGTPIQFVDVFPNTPDRRVHLFPEALETANPDGLYAYQPDPSPSDYPLALISPATEKTISSTLGELRPGIASIYMHADDAARRGIEEGDTVRVFNAQGEVQCKVTLGDAIARGTVSLAKGLWRKSTFNRWTSNALVPDSLTDLGGGACFNDARVEVARVMTASFEDQPVTIYVPHERAVH